MAVAYWIGVVLLAVAALVVTWLALGYLVFRLYVRPKRMRWEGAPEDWGLEYRDVRFASEDGVELAAWVLLPPGYEAGQRRPGIVSSHGYKACREHTLDRSARLAGDGYVVLAFEWRGCGLSGGRDCSGGVTEPSDLRAATEYLLALPEVDPERIAYYGFSMGGMISILVAAEDERVRTVVADSPYANMYEESRTVMWEMFLPPFLFLDLMDYFYKRKYGVSMRDVDALEAVARISPRPLLLLAGDADITVPIEHSHRLMAAAGEPKRQHVTPGADHFGNATEENFREVILPFFREVLK